MKNKFSSSLKIEASEANLRNWSRRWVRRHGEQALHQKVDMGASKTDRMGTRPEVGVKSINAAADSAIQAFSKSCNEATGLAPRAYEGKGGFAAKEKWSEKTLQPIM